MLSLKVKDSRVSLDPNVYPFFHFQIMLLPTLQLLGCFTTLVLAQLPRYQPHHGHGCMDDTTKAFPFCDTTLSIADRVVDLVSRMTLAQKIANRYDLESDSGLGFEPFNWNQEGLHGLGAQCFQWNSSTPARCPSVFASPTTLGASFNLTLLRDIGDAISTEARAYNNHGGNRGYANRPVDLNVWLPNLNVGRDARWGREVEVFSEDPWYIGKLGSAMIQGTQVGGDGGASGAGYLKMIVAAKHATAYQVENNRFDRNENITQHDLSDTFYPAWEVVVEEGKVAGFMCSYNAINGVPSCASTLLLTELFKETWGLGTAWQGGGYIQGDCGAMENVYKTYHYAQNLTYAAAMVLNAGGDVDCGGALPNGLSEAIALGLTTESTLDSSLIRTYTLQFLAGRFDPIDSQPYMAIPFEAIDSPATQDIAYESAVQGMVLLRNDGGVLPLKPPFSGRLALIGPHTNSTGDLMGNYFEARCPDNTFDCVPSLYATLPAYLEGGGGALLSALGCPMKGGDASGIPAALAVAKAADVVVLALGTDSSVANEGSDRADASLPGFQAQLAAEVLALGKPTVVLLFNGGTLTIDNITYWTPLPGQEVAIVEAFFPGERGGVPVADVLFGKVNRWGKLPVTMYPADYYTQVPIDDMSMVPTSTSPGRTYKYYPGPTLFPLGFGLSYTTFKLTGNCPVGGQGEGEGEPAMSWSLPAGDDADRGTGSSRYATRTPALNLPTLNCTITVQNTGGRDGDEVVQVFVYPNATSIVGAAGGFVPGKDPLAIKRLVGFQRVFVPVGGSVDVPFSIPVDSLHSFDGVGDKVVWAGEYKVVVTRGGGGLEDDVVWGVKVGVNGGGGKFLVRKYPHQV